MKWCRKTAVSWFWHDNRDLRLAWVRHDYNTNQLISRETQYDRNTALQVPSLCPSRCRSLGGQSIDQTHKFKAVGPQSSGLQVLSPSLCAQALRGFQPQLHLTSPSVSRLVHTQRLHRRPKRVLVKAKDCPSVWRRVVGYLFPTLSLRGVSQQLTTGADDVVETPSRCGVPRWAGMSNVPLHLGLR